MCIVDGEETARVGSTHTPLNFLLKATKYAKTALIMKTIHIEIPLTYYPLYIG